MAIKVTLHHPTSGRSWEMEPDPSSTPAALLNELIEEGMLPRTPEGYELNVKGGKRLPMDASLESEKVESGAQLVVVPFSKGGR